MKKIYLLFILICVLISCRKENTMWTSNWVFPLINDTLSLKQLVEDTILSIDNNGYYFVNVNKKIVDIDIADELTIKDTTINQKSALSINSMNVPPGFEFLSESQEHDFDFQGAQLKSLRLKKGKIKISIYNPYQTKAIFTLMMPKITKNGIGVSNELTANEGTSQNPSLAQFELDLAGYDINLTGENNNSYNKLLTVMKVKSDPNGESTTITNQDSIYFKIVFKDFKLDYARGYFGQYVLDEATTETVDLFSKISGNIDVDQLDFNVFIENGVKADAKVQVNSIKSINTKTGNEVSLNHPLFANGFNVETATGTWDNLNKYRINLNFNPTNSNVLDFLNNWGNQIELDYKFQLNPYGNISAGWNEYFPQSRFVIGIEANMPLNVGINNLMLRDTFDVNFDNDKDDFHFVEGDLILKAENAFPLDGKVKLFLLDEWNNILSEVSNEQHLQTSIYGQLINGIQTSKSELKFSLTPDQLYAFEKVKKVMFEVKLNTLNSQSNTYSKVKIPANAFLKLHLSTKFKLANVY